MKPVNLRNKSYQFEPHLHVKCEMFDKHPACLSLGVRHSRCPWICTGLQFHGRVGNDLHRYLATNESCAFKNKTYSRDDRINQNFLFD